MCESFQCSSTDATAALPERGFPPGPVNSFRSSFDMRTASATVGLRHLPVFLSLT